jgi:hypothetical protein
MKKIPTVVQLKELPIILLFIYFHFYIYFILKLNDTVGTMKFYISLNVVLEHQYFTIRL